MARFFTLFEENNIRLKKFVDSLTTKPGTEDALISHRKSLLTLLADVCMDKARQYGHLADRLSAQKRRAGQPASPPP